MKRSASVKSRLFSIQVMSCSAGSRSSTAIRTSGNNAPSITSAQSISSDNDDESQPNCPDKIRDTNLAQLFAVGS